MFFDLFIGVMGGVVAYYLGFGWNSVVIFLGAIILDSDILVNEFIKIFIKKEKDLRIDSLLDEHSYTHKFLFHLPLIVIPLSFIGGLLYSNLVFASLLSLMVFMHLVHDTIDDNFDGVCWLWPFNANSYKLRNFSFHFYLVIKSRATLKKEADWMAINPRNAGRIWKANKFF